MSNTARTVMAGVVALGIGVGASVAYAAQVDVTPGNQQGFVFRTAPGDTRETGHYAWNDDGLHVWTEGATSTDKVAGYTPNTQDLADVGEPSMVWDQGYGTIAPGLQLIIDFGGPNDTDETADGILVGEEIYAGDWWANNGAEQFVKDAAPSHEGGSGSDNHGTLDQWRAAFPDAQLTNVGFSLGSGVFAGGVMQSLTFGDDTYTFGLDEAPEPPEDTVITATLQGQNLAGQNGMDRLFVRTAPADEAAAATVRFYRVADNGNRTLVRTASLNGQGAKTVEVADPQPQVHNSYVAVVDPTDDTTGDESNLVSIR